MNWTLKYLLLLALTLTLSSVVSAETTEDSPVDNKSTYHIGDDIDLISAKEMKYQKNKMIIKMVFPRLSTSNDNAESASTIKTNAFNEHVKKIIDEEISNFKQKIVDAKDYQDTLEKSKIKNRLTIDFNSAVINLDEQPIISIRFVIQGYVTGMAHPFRRYRVLNFDMDAGSSIQLAELFQPESNYMEVLSQFANNELAKKIRGNPMQASAAATEDHYTNWNINVNGLRITFDEATVAPYVYGSQSILIPYSALKELINPESALGHCLAHRKKCMRDHLLTGGFIDEAANTKHRRLNPALS